MVREWKDLLQRDETMITIHIAINNDSIMHFSARRVSGEDNDLCAYKTDDNQIIKHYPKDGALVLAKKMMRRW